MTKTSTLRLGFAAWLVIVAVAALAVDRPARADTYQNVTVGLSGFVFNGKKLPEAYADELDKLDNADSPNDWLDRIDALGKTARNDYWRGMPHLQPLFRKALHDRCGHYLAGKQASFEAYEVCFGTELRNESIKARAAAKAGVTDLAQLALASPTLAAEISRRCGDGVGVDVPAVCITETLATTAKALSSASGATEHALSAWSIASNLRAACDEKYGSPENPQPCTSQKSVANWHNTFRPSADAPAEGVPSPVPPQPGCKPRSLLLEDTVAACLNDGCGQAVANEAAGGCSLLANPDLSPFASNRVKETVSYLDADSLVFLTRARMVSQLLDANYKATGGKLGIHEIPQECQTNPELLNGILHTPRAPLEHPGGELATAAARLTHTANGLVSLEGKDTGIPDLNDVLEGELVKEPALLPLDATGELNHDLAFSRSIVSSIGRPDRVLALLRGNANRKTTEALRQICKADWVELVNMPIARKAALEIGGTISRQGNDEACKETEHFPADMQAKYGKCMPWLLRCMFAQVTSQQKREMIGNMCMAASMGIAIVVPPAGFAAGAACAGVTTVNHALARSDEADARKLAVVCTGLKPSECNPGEIAALTREMQHEIVAAGVDIVLQLGAPYAAGKVLSLAGRGLAIAAPEARALLSQLKILRLGIGKEGAAASQAEADALAAKIEAMFNKAGVEMPKPPELAAAAPVAPPKPIVFDLPVDAAPAAPNPKPRLELVLQPPDPPALPKTKPRLKLVLQPEDDALTHALPATKAQPPLELDLSDLEPTSSRPTVPYPAGQTPIAYPNGVSPDSPTVVYPRTTPLAGADATTVPYPKGQTPIAYPNGVSPDSPTVVYPRSSAPDAVTVVYPKDTPLAGADATVPYPKGQTPIAYPNGVSPDSPTVVYPANATPDAVTVANPTTVHAGDPVTVANPTLAHAPDPVTVANPTLVHTPDPVTVANSTTVQTGEPVTVANPTAVRPPLPTRGAPRGINPESLPDVTDDAVLVSEPATNTAAAKPAVKSPPPLPTRGVPRGINPESLPDVTDDAVLVSDPAADAAAAKPAVKSPPPLPRRAPVKPLAKPAIEDVTEHAQLNDDVDDLLELSEPSQAPTNRPATPKPRGPPPLPPRAPAARPALIDPADLEDATQFAEPANATPTTVPAAAVPSPIRGAPRLKAPATTYSSAGKTSEELAKEATGLKPADPIEVVGKGGMNRVWGNAQNPAKVVKVLDRQLIWTEMKHNITDLANDAAKKGERTLQNQYEALLAHYERNIRAGDTVPSDVDKMIAQVIQRHRVLGGPLRNEILPVLQRELRAQGVRVSMLKGLENISDAGVSSVDRVVLGKAADGTTMVDAKEYLKTLAEGSPEYNQGKALQEKLNTTMKPYNDRAIKSNREMDILLTKGRSADGLPQIIGYDFGNPTDKFGNLYLKLGTDGRVVEMIIGDY